MVNWCYKGTNLQKNYRIPINIVTLHSLLPCNPFITLYLGSIEINHVINELCYKGTILQKNYRLQNMGH